MIITKLRDSVKNETKLKNTLQNFEDLRLFLSKILFKIARISMILFTYSSRRHFRFIDLLMIKL